jgi:hypothetical protein
MVAFPVLFPVWFVMLFAISLGRVPFDRVLSSLPAPVKVIGSLLVAYVFLDFFLMLALVPGQPVEQGGSFFFNDHGLVRTTETAYRQGLAYQARLISGHEMLFFGLAAVFGFQIDRLRRGKTSLPEAKVPAIGAVISPGPLDRRVVLETGLRPDDCVTRLRSRLGPLLGGSWGRQMELWGLVSSEGFSLQMGRGGSTRQLVLASGGFAQTGRRTRIEVWLQFKRGGVAAIVGGVVAFPIVGVVMDAITGGSHDFAAFTAAIAVVVMVANLAFALYQRNRPLSLIERALEAHRVETLGGPN